MITIIKSIWSFLSKMQDKLWINVVCVVMIRPTLSSSADAASTSSDYMLKAKSSVNYTEKTKPLH